MKLTRNEIDSLKNYIDLLMQLQDKQRREGLLSLEEAIQCKEGDCLFPKGRDIIYEGTRLVIDGVDATIIEKLFNNWIKADCNNDTDLLYYNVIKEGILNIQMGTNPWLLYPLLISYIPREYLKEFSALKFFSDED